MERKTHIALLLAMTSALSANAQENTNKVEATIGADLVSSYIWRGQKLGNAAVQPSVGVAYKGLSINAWGSVDLSSKDIDDEFDITLSYTTGALTVSVTDYWFFHKGDSVRNNYFNYGAHSTAHVFEGTIGYDFGPVAASWSTNFTGADGQNKSGKRSYSSYFQVTAPFKLGGLDWNAELGIVPWNTSFYSDVNGFAVTNVAIQATKNIKITDHFDLPIFGKMIWNPATEAAYFVFGLCI